MLRFLIRDALQWDKSKFELMKKKIGIIYIAIYSIF